MESAAGVSGSIPVPALPPEALLCRWMSDVGPKGNVVVDFCLSCQEGGLTSPGLFPCLSALSHTKGGALKDHSTCLTLHFLNCRCTHSLLYVFW